VSQRAQRRDAVKLASTAGLLLLDAMVMQEVLAARDRRIRTLAQIRAHSNVKRAFETEWNKIVSQIDYEPIFQMALKIARCLPATAAVNDSLRRLAELAEDIAGSKVLLKHDLFGRVYHQLLLGKLVKYFATYYTSIPAARLLARLLVNLKSPLDANSVPPTYGGEPLRVVDFACGSGTLLSAMYKELDVKHRLDAEKPDPESLHRYLLEDGLWGFDVLLHAVHLAATVLFLHDPLPVEGSRLYALRLEKAGSRAFLGSIDFLVSRTLTPSALLTGGVRHAGREVSVRGAEGAGISLPDFHMCIMNPPFTRSVGGNLLFGGLPEEQRRELQRELRDLLSEQDISGIGQAGLGAVFFFIADRYLVPGGRLGLVLPRSVLSGVSWRKVRERLLEGYHIEYVVTSYAGKNRWNFSENTDYSEILLVARKLREGEEPGYTYFVNLWKRPESELESIYIGSQLIDLYESARLYDIENSNASPYRLKLHGRSAGEVYSAKLTDQNIGSYNFFAQAELNRTARLLRNGNVYVPGSGVIGRVRLTPLASLGVKIGPDRRQIHDAFSVEDLAGGAVYRALWGHDIEKMRTIRQAPNAALRPKPGKRDAAASLWRERGRLLLGERINLGARRLIAAYVGEPVLSNVWWPMSADEDVEKILALWFNCTLGMIALLTSADVTGGPWIQLKKAELMDVPVLDVSRLSPEQRDALLQIFEEIKDREFKPIQEEFASPEARKILDEGVNEALGIHADLSPLYEFLSKDPMITWEPLV